MNITFLTHMARSGSTLVARELSRFEALSVGIEESLPDGIVKGEEVLLEDRDELDEWLERAWKDEKLAAWDIEQDALRNRLINNHSFPLRFREILEELLRLYFNHDLSDCVIHKKGPYYRYIDSVRAQFPDARFIHVDRDPRGIYNSQKKAARSDSGRTMAEAPATFAFQYLAARHAMNRYQDEPYFFVVRYEDFLKDSRRELLRIMDFLGLQEKKERGNSPYLERIPGSQHHLHENLKKEIIPDRATSWKEELKAEELYFFQKALGKTLRINGYPLVGLSPLALAVKVPVWRKLIAFYIKYTLKRWFPALYRLAGGETG